MKYCRYQTPEGSSYGLLEERAGAFVVTATLDSPWVAEPAITALPAPIALADLTLLPPVAPGKIICVGRNYRDHAKELGNDVPAEPLLFWKPTSSLLAPGGTILRPPVAERVDFEGELAVIIGHRARKLKASDEVAPYLHGFTLANDVTARDLQKKDGQWTRAKGFDTFCPVGPIVDTAFDLGTGVTLETHVNGELRQHGSTADFIFDIPTLLAYITAAFTLEPGDLLLTGTPAGVGPIVVGDLVTVSVPGLGTLSNAVADE
jgi:2-keto-4-pentenoate hydratase/2-oxohepta-3-ene-1,7-dioic acid hydratase in catechol pathway